jgi:cytochrome c-type biogenesis protein CcmH/NrfG
MPVRAGLRAQVGIEYELRPDRTMKRARACWYVGRTTVMVQVLASVYSAWGFGLLSAFANPFVCFTPQRSGASRSTRLASTVTVPAVERCPEQYLTNG